MLMTPEAERYPTFIHRLIHDTEHPAFRAWTWVVNALIYLSCVAIALESVEAVKADYHWELATFEWFSVVFFTLDYAFNIYTANNRLKYVTSFWGMVDLLSILPSFLMLFNFSSVRATKILRLLRVIRILRVLKLARSAMNDVSAAVLMISSTLMFYVEGGLYTPDAIADGQMHMDAAATARGEPVGATKFLPSDPLTGATIPDEKRFFTSIPETMWWCIVTLTTTGYGDLYPVTIGGRLIAAVTMLLGLVLFGMLMNIVGKTLMVMLFGEPVGHEAEHKLKTPEEKIGAAFDLLADAGVITHKSAYMLKDVPVDELSERLQGDRVPA